MAYISFQPKDYFNTVLYAGNSTTTNAITGVGFQPDWVWLKGRTIAESHRIYDVVRGASNHISSNGTAAQASNFPLTSFDSDGFTIGSSDGSVNGAYNYASWNWLANGSGSANTDGSISSTVSASTTSGFSIVDFTATGSASTIGHGMSAIPKMILVKRTDSTSSWAVYHASLGATKYLELNETQAEATNSGRWNDTTPTSSVFTIGTEWGSGTELIAYCFAEKKGFSKFGSYTGNGNADGTFVYTGFKPAFVLFKQSSSAGNSWNIQDNKRVGYNPNNNRLFANNAVAENTTSFRLDLLSNGFKMNNSDADSNGSGSTYIYMAFAEHPLVSSNDIPATAR